MLVLPFNHFDKIYFEHPDSKDIKVPFKKISQTDTISENGNVKNPDLIVYDTSGPYQIQISKQTQKASRSIEKIGLKILIQKEISNALCKERDHHERNAICCC